MANWIFTVRDQRQNGRRVAAADLFRSRVEHRFWVVNQHNRNFGRLRRGDRVVFYLGGRDGKKFVGSAALASGPKSLTPRLRGLVLSQPSSFFNHYVELGEVRVWRRPKRIEELLSSLSFIRHKENWKNYLQGGFRAIPEEDYELLISAGQP